jgi:protein-tyrosine-phosphatase
MKVLFVCSGNICRSPMAAEYMRHRLGDVGLAHVIVDSAGTLGIEGAPASGPAVRILAEHGVDLRGHRSRGLDRKDLRTADLVLAMSIDHITEIERVSPDPPGDVHLLRAFEHGVEPNGGAPDLPDPIGREDAVYRREFAVIRTCVEHVLLRLRNAAPER